MVASLAGAHPGFTLGRLHVPLNFDVFTALSWSFANSRILVNTFGKTDAKGRASAAFQASPNLLAGYAGQTLTFVCVLVDRLNLVSNPLSVALKP